MCFHPNNTNLAFISNSVGEIHYYDNLLHYDAQQTDVKTKICERDKEVHINQINISSCGTQLMYCTKQG